MKKSFLILLLPFFFLYTKSGNSQERFKIAAVAGFNLSQIDGDNFTGYDKFGIGGGLRASTILTERFRVDFEILYSQRGSYSGRFEGFSSSPHFFNVQLNYAEIPIIGSFRWKGVIVKAKKRGKKLKYYKYALNGGLSVGRLLSLSVDEKINLDNVHPQALEKIISFDKINEDFIKTDLSATLGLSYYFTKNIGLTGRFSVSLTPLYNPADNEGVGNKLRNFYLTTLMFYEF